jgi:hypothetical protein
MNIHAALLWMNRVSSSSDNEATAQIGISGLFAVCGPSLVAPAVVENNAALRANAFTRYGKTKPNAG